MNFSSAEQRSEPVWIAVNAHPNRERTAEQNLRNQEYEPYCPVIRKQIRHARRGSEALRPLYPGYLFVRLEPGQIGFYGKNVARSRTRLRKQRRHESRLRTDVYESQTVCRELEEIADLGGRIAEFHPVVLPAKISSDAFRCEDMEFSRDVQRQSWNSVPDSQRLASIEPPVARDAHHEPSGLPQRKWNNGSQRGSNCGSTVHRMVSSTCIAILVTFEMSRTRLPHAG